MAGRGLPAMTGPAGHGRGQEAAGGAVVVEGAAPAGGGLVRCLARVFGNEAAVEHGSVETGRGAGRIEHGTGPDWRRQAMADL